MHFIKNSKTVQLIKVIAFFGIIAFTSFSFGSDVFAQSSRGWDPSTASTGTGLPDGSIEGVVIAIMFFLLRLVAILAVISFIISGIMYLLASANEDLMEKGKKGITTSIIGFIVATSGAIIIKQIYCILVTGGISLETLISSPFSVAACAIFGV